MLHVPAWRRYRRFWRPDPDADVADELRTHLELRVAELRSQGAGEAEAHAQAVAEFGDVEATRQRLVAINARMARRRARFLWWDALRTDLRYALRGLRTSPGFAVTVVATIGLALGATATMYGVADRLLLSPPPGLSEPAELGRLHLTYVRADGGERSIAGFPFGFAEVARTAAEGWRAASYTHREVPVGEGATATKTRARYVSPGYFSLLGVRPALGRMLNDTEAHHESGARIAVLGHALWQQRFGGDPEVLGRTIDVRGVPFRVVGVAPRGFHGTRLLKIGIWLPMAALYDAPGARESFTLPGNALWGIDVRRADDGSAGAVEARLGTMFWRYATESGDVRPGRTRSVRASVVPLTGGVGSDLRRTREATVAAWLVGMTGVLLLVACANVAGLTLLRVGRRRHEFAVRVALGVGRRRLAGQLVTESVVLAAAGGLAALLIAGTAGVWLQRTLLTDVAADAWALDAGVLGVTAVAVLGTALLVGLSPAAYAVRVDLRSVLGAARPGAPGGTGRRAPQRVLLVTQTALSLVLLVGAGLFLRSLHNLRGIELGMEPGRVIAADVDLDAVGWDATRASAFFDAARERLRTAPGIEAAALAAFVPLESGAGGAFTLPGRDSIPLRAGESMVRNDVSPEFFEVMGTRLVHGRLFDARDRSNAAPITLVNETMARRLWPGRSPLGECFRLGDDPRCWSVVGVVRDARTFSLVEEQQLQYYLPLAQSGFTGGPAVVLARTAGDAAGHVGAVRRRLHDIVPGQPFVDVRVLEDRLDPELRPWRLGATIFSAFGLLAALLAALGLYAAVAYAVTQRTRELGVRRAVGARASNLVWLVLRDSLAIAAVGTAVGALLALAGGRYVADLLFDVSPRDPLVLGTVAGALVLVALLASLVPAARAARVDPMVALRAE